MYNSDEVVNNFKEWKEKIQEFVNRLSEKDREFYFNYLKSEDDESLQYYEKWIAIKPIEMFVLPFYIYFLICYGSSYKQKIMELYLRFLILSNHRDYQIENYLERELW